MANPSSSGFDEPFDLLVIPDHLAINTFLEVTEHAPQVQTDAELEIVVQKSTQPTMQWSPNTSIVIANRSARLWATREAMPELRWKNARSILMSFKVSEKYFSVPCAFSLLFLSIALLETFPFLGRLAPDSSFPPRHDFHG